MWWRSCTVWAAWLGWTVVACGRSELTPGDLADAFGGSSSRSGGASTGVSGSKPAVGGSGIAGSAPTAGRSGDFGGVGGTGIVSGGTAQFAGEGGAPSSAGEGGVGGAPDEPLTVVDFALAPQHTCALLSDGSVVCWGLSEKGALGYGNTDTIGDDELPISAGRVVLTARAGLRATNIVAGGAHTCALLSDTSVRCWGSNDFGQLGFGNDDTEVGSVKLPSTGEPIVVTNEPGVGVKQLVAGDAHTCALLTNGGVVCWGEAIWGSLGYGNGDTVGDTESPAAAGLVNLTSEPCVVATQLSAGMQHTCALLSNGAVKCWGFNNWGQLGLGHDDPIGETETPESAPAVQLSVDPGVFATQVMAGWTQTCALLSDDTVKCWGFTLTEGGGKLILGDNELPSSVDSAVYLTNAPGVRPTQLSVGLHHNCVRLSDGSAKCWGANNTGQLGRGSTATLAATQVAASDAIAVSANGATVTRIVAGGFHTCAVLSDGSGKCWGSNAEGELGIGTTANVGDDESPSSLDALSLF